MACVCVYVCVCSCHRATRPGPPGLSSPHACSRLRACFFASPRRACRGPSVMCPRRPHTGPRQSRPLPQVRPGGPEARRRHCHSCRQGCYRPGWRPPSAPRLRVLMLPAPYPQAVLFNDEADLKKDQGLPAGWTEHLDEKTGLPFYYAVSTATTVWQRPSEPAPPAARSGGCRRALLRPRLHYCLLTLCPAAY